MIQAPGPPPVYYAPPPPPPFNIGAALTRAWYTFRQHWKVFVAAMVFPVVVMLAYYVAFLVIYVPFWHKLAVGPETATDAEASDFFKHMLVLSAIYLVLMIPTYIFYINLFRMALVAADEGTPTYKMIFSLNRMGRIFATGFVLMIGIILGTFLCYVPGLALAAFSCFTVPFILDKDLSGLAAVKASFSLVRDNLGLVLLTLLVAGAISSAGSVALLVGIAVSMPVAVLTLAYAYRSLVPRT